MQAFAITNKGAEKTAAAEIPGLIGCKNIYVKETVVVFDIKKPIELCIVCYRSQSINRGIFLLAHFKVDKDLAKTIENLKSGIEEADMKDWLAKTNRVDCERHGIHNFNSVEAAEEASRALNAYLKKKYEHAAKTDFDSPDILYYLYIYGEEGYFGIDFSGIDLAKRQYKIFNHPESLKGVTGYILAREGELKKRSVMIDPFMGSGVIVIEAALHLLSFPVQYYTKDRLFFTHLDFFKRFGEERFFSEQDKCISDLKTKIYGYDHQLRYLNASQKNAKLAGIEKSITLSKVDIEWLDTKFDRACADCIISDPPRVSKHKETVSLKKVFKELFYQAEYILKKKGRVILISKESRLLEEAAGMHKFKLIKNYSVWQGQEEYRILTFGRV